MAKHGAIGRLMDAIFIRLLLRPAVMERLQQEMLTRHVVFGSKQRFSKAGNVILNNALINTASGEVHIAEDVFLGHDVMLLTGTHDCDATGAARLGHEHEGRDILIERGVWLASRVTVIGPATIGENAVVGAGSLVLGDVPENTLYAGIPARLIRHLDTR